MSVWLYKRYIMVKEKLAHITYKLYNERNKYPPLWIKQIFERDKKMSEVSDLLNAYSFFDQEDNATEEAMRVEDLLVDIACQFIKYRDKNDMTQKELADKLQITQAMVSKLESGEYNPTVKMLFEIARKLSWDFKIEFHDVR